MSTSMPKKSDLLEQFTQAVFDKLKADGMPVGSVVVEDPKEGLSSVASKLSFNIPFPYGTVVVHDEVEL